jgi:hypothetical protein
MRLRLSYTARSSKSFVFNARSSSVWCVNDKPYYPLYAKKDLLPKSYIELIGKKHTRTIHGTRLPDRLVTRPDIAFQFHQENPHEENCHL